MNNILILLLAAALLAGCAGKPRAGGPAPVESVRDRSAPNAVAPAPVEPVVDVYAYRGPNKAPAAAPPSANPPKESGGSSGTMLALRSETPDPGRASRANVTPKPQEVDPGLAPAIAWTPPPTAAVAPKPPPAQVLPPTSAQAQAPASAAPSKTGPAVNSASAGGTPPKAPTPVPVKPAPPPPPPPPVARYTAPPPAAPELPAAASSLAAQAEKQRERGDYVAAAATLERAIRIQPREAYLWNRLARVRLDQNNYAQAGSLAQKSNTLSKDQDQIKQDNWGMIATTRRAAGDQSGAQEAEAKAGTP
ncbi:MAG: tetratricopeptide repeat protein [Chromatiaceae bacterium]